MGTAALCGITATAVLAGASAASADVVWLCKPGMDRNPCEIGQDTTIREYDKPDRVETPAVGAREIDCFYVYPTVSNQPTPNANKNRDPELDSVAKYQAARFSNQCRVFAPIYRQQTLATLVVGRGSSGADPELAYGDVLEAWREYMATDNGGRGVVLIGHSQGTQMLRRLLRLEIEPHPDQLRRIVLGVLPGGNVTVPEGRLVGGDFRLTPLCERPAQVACVVAFSTFAEDPPEDSSFGRPRQSSTFPSGPGYEVACNDPRTLAGWREHLRILTPSEPFAPGAIAAGSVHTYGGPPPSASTTWVVPPDRFEGTCKRINGAHVLRYDPVGQSRRPTASPEDTWGTHGLDINITLDPLVSLVGQQAERWNHPNIQLVQRCLRNRRLRVELAGREAEFVRDVAFRIGRRTVARDKKAPFARTLSRRTLEKGRGRRLRAVASLRLGARDRVSLAGARARC